MAPAVLIPTLVAVASSGFQVFSQIQQANATNAAFKQNQENALVANRQAQDALSAQSNEDRISAAQENLQTVRAAAAARARAQAAGASANVAGLSVDQIINESGFGAGEALVNTAANLNAREDQRFREREGIVAQTTARINSAPRASVSPLAAGLQIGFSALKGVAEAGAFE